MSAEVHRIRSVKEHVSFKMKRERLTEYEASQLKAVVRQLRRESRLPGDDDVDDVIPPVVPIWRRRVPNTDLWVFYDANDEHLLLWTVKALDWMPSL